jgi:hypothetical protein
VQRHGKHKLKEWRYGRGKLKKEEMGEVIEDGGKRREWGGRRDKEREGQRDRGTE